MADKIIKTIFKLRRGQTEQWESVNPILAEGEPGFAIDANVLKIGNGIDPWNDLDEIGGGSESGELSVIIGDDNSIVINDNTAKLLGFDTAEAGAQPRKNAEGKLEWYIPSGETSEEIQAVVTDLQADVTEMQTVVAGKVDAEEGKSLVDDTQIAKLETIAENADENVLEVVYVGETALDVNEDKAVTIPVGAGLQASEEITITNGVLGIGGIGVSKLVDDDTTLYLDGGSASGK